MQVTIIPEDGFVAVDRCGYLDLDLSFMDPAIHAVQFKNGYGFIEYKDLDDFTKPPNQPITSIAPFQQALDVWAIRDEEAKRPPPPVDPVILIEAGIRQRLDEFAQTRGYDGILSLCSYANSTNPQFKLEGEYGVQARDTTWGAWHAILADITADVRPMPSDYAGVEPELPVLDWPVQPE
jgi:hypothetical protein